MQHREALQIAEELLHHMRPHCQRIAIGGSIRREKAHVKDIELVIIPKWQRTVDPTDLFGERLLLENELYAWADTEAHRIGLQWIKPSVEQIIPWTVKPRARYWRGYLPAHQMKVDIFFCIPASWGNILLLRTGSAVFNTKLMLWADRRGYKFQNGLFMRALAGDGRQPIAVREEDDIFRLLGLEYIAPKDRSERTIFQQRRYQLERYHQVAGLPDETRKGIAF